MTDFLNFILSCLSGTVSLLFQLELVSGVSCGAVIVIGFLFSALLAILFRVVKP